MYCDCFVWFSEIYSKFSEVYSKFSEIFTKKSFPCHSRDRISFIIMARCLRLLSCLVTYVYIVIFASYRQNIQRPVVETSGTLWKQLSVPWPLSGPITVILYFPTELTSYNAKNVRTRC
jgi:hypothetical protein